MLFNEYREFLGGLTNVSNQQLGMYVTMAEERVIEDGCSRNNTKYRKMTKLALGMILATTAAQGDLQSLGATGGGKLKKIQVADVTKEYETGSSNSSTASARGIIKDLPGGGYEAVYQRELKPIVGNRHRFNKKY